VYLQPGAVDPMLSPDTVLGLARDHIPDVHAVTAVDESGGEARAYMIDTDIVVKTQRPHRLRPRTSLAKEAHLLDCLNMTPLAGRVPRLFGYTTADTAQGPVEYLCMSRVPGRAMINVAELPAPRRVAMLTELAGMLRVLHGLDTDSARASGLVPTDPDAAALRTRLALGFADLLDEVAEQADAWTLPQELAEVAAVALTALPDALAQPPVMLHSNPGRTHTFVDTTTGTLTGLIDFGDSYLSHPAMDLRSWPDPSDRRLLHDAYLDGAAVDDEFERVWTVAMIHTDVKVIAGAGPYARAAAEDLTRRLAEL
jgi:aminoglycoside phosphotransferase (APT) family kinase protein